MGTLPRTESAAPAGVRRLFLLNSPARFWRLLPEAPSAEWEVAAAAAAAVIPGGVEVWQAGGWEGLAAHVLGEGQFGPAHWRLAPLKRLYFAFRGFLPRWVRPVLRRLTHARWRSAATLGWPVEDRYVRFQFETVARLLRNRGQRTAQFLSLWPAGKRYAFVLTHDVETERGQAFVRELAALEVGLGFRSSFNFVAEGYHVDLQLIAELRERGFEVGVHGLKHDGKLFSSEQEFLRRARRINKYLREWGAVGFRAPLTHRHPEWMQALDIEYDSSFCDTDPFETVSGGTMSIWPFVMGAFIELPYTLPQDHIVLSTLRERAPTTWLQKLEFIAQHLGMALLGAHPDYLRVPEHLKVYEAFLLEVRRRGNSWNALPRDVARWWRARQECRPACRHGHWEIHGLPGATVADLALRDDPDGSTSDGPPALVIEGLTAEGRAPSATVSER